MKYRSVITYKMYFESFFEKLEIPVQIKIINTIRYIEEIERIPKNILSILAGQKDYMKFAYNSGMINLEYFLFLIKVC